MSLDIGACRKDCTGHRQQRQHIYECALRGPIAHKHFATKALYQKHNGMSCLLPHSLKSGDKGGSLRTVSDTAGVLRLFSGGKGIAVTAAY